MGLSFPNLNLSFIMSMQSKRLELGCTEKRKALIKH